MLWPTPLPERSRQGTFFFSGVLGGILSGMFAFAGPPLIYQYYRQPLPLATVRNCLILLFAVSSLIRVVFIASQGGVSTEMLLVSLLALPVVALATVAGRRLPPPLSDRTMRRIAFVMLTVIGATLAVPAVSSLVTGAP